MPSLNDKMRAFCESSEGKAAMAKWEESQKSRRAERGDVLIGQYTGTRYKVTHREGSYIYIASNGDREPIIGNVRKLSWYRHEDGSKVL